MGVVFSVLYVRDWVSHTKIIIYATGKDPFHVSHNTVCLRSKQKRAAHAKEVRNAYITKVGK